MKAGPGVGLCITALFFVTSYVNGQTLLWDKNYGGYDVDDVRDMQKTFDGGFILAGRTNSQNIDISNYFNQNDYWITKIDTAGNIQWESNYGGSSHDYASSVQQTRDSGYIVAGYSSSNDKDVSGNYGGQDYWVVKLDSVGNIQWEQNYGGSGPDLAVSIRQTKSEDYILAGTSTSNDKDVSGNYGSEDAWVVKLDETGTILWEQNYGGSDWDEVSGIEITGQNEFILYGYSMSDDIDVPGNYGNMDCWVLKVGNGGNVEWKQNYGSTGYDEVGDIQKTGDGGYIIAGESSKPDNDVSGNYGGGDFWILKVDSVGNIQWDENYGGSNHDQINSIQKTYDGGFVLTGSTESNDQDISNARPNSCRSSFCEDYWILKIDSTGNKEWNEVYGGSGIDIPDIIQQANDGNYVVVGQSNSSDYDVSNNYGTWDYWIIKVKPPCDVTRDTITVNSCDNFTSPSGKYTWTKSGTYKDTLSDVQGCDSILTINLTIHKKSFDTINQTACYDYTVPSGDETYHKNGIYNDTITKAKECNSIITIDLNINNTSDTLSKAVCHNYTVPSGDETYNETGRYHDTLENSKDCDSIIVIDLDVNNTYDTLNKAVCHSYTVPSGDETYDSSGTYVDTIPNSNGCDSIITIKLDLKTSPTSSFTVQEPCEGTPFSLKYQTALNKSPTHLHYLYLLNGDTSKTKRVPVNSTIDTGMVTLNHQSRDTGVFKIKQIVASSVGCVDSFTANVNVHPKPKSAFTVQDTSQCLNSNFFQFTNSSTSDSDTTQFKWDFGNGDSSSAKAVSYQYQKAGKYSVKLIAESRKGCSDTSYQQIQVRNNPEAAFQVKEPCTNMKTEFLSKSKPSADSIVKHLWDFEQGITDSGRSVQQDFSEPGTYRVNLTVVNKNRCRDSMTREVDILAVPKPDFSVNDTSQCLKTNAFTFRNKTESPNNNINYRWDFGNGVESLEEAPSLSYEKSGNYEVKLTAINNVCTSEIVQDVNVQEQIDATFDVVQKSCDPTVELKADHSTEADHIWSLKDTNYFKNPPVNHEFQRNGEYTVTHITNPDKKCPDTNHKTVKAMFFSSEKIEIPNVITPNGDRKNEEFVVQGLDGCGSLKLSIYNRWGHLIYQTKGSKNLKWGGKSESQGDILPSGTYYYALTGDEFSRKGTITLIK